MYTRVKSKRKQRVHFGPMDNIVCLHTTIVALTEYNLVNGLYNQQGTRASIIALGIRKQPKEQPYRRSRAGNKLFHRIHSIISSREKLATEKKSLISTIDHTNLQPIPVSKFTSKCINISHINARSINNKVLDFQQYVTSDLIDICAISETWIKSDVDTNAIKEIAPQEYRWVPLKARFLGA